MPTQESGPNGSSTNNAGKKKRSGHSKKKRMLTTGSATNATTSKTSSNEKPIDALSLCKSTKHHQNTISNKHVEEDPSRNKRAPLDASCPSDDVLDHLNMLGIDPILKPSSKFKSALYHCRLCGYHCDNVSRSLDHSVGLRHRIKQEKRDNGTLLENLPPPSSAHVAALDRHVDKVVASSSLSASETARRLHSAEQVIELLRSHLTPHFAGLLVTLYGSLISGLSLISSNVNISLDLNPRGKGNLAELMQRGLALLSNFGMFCGRVESSFSSQSPDIHCFDEQGVLYRIALNCGTHYHTANLLAQYAAIEPRAKVLMIALRSFAHAGHIDCAEKGTLTAHCFDLMVVHFLLRCKPPVLPLLTDKDFCSELLPLENLDNCFKHVDLEDGRLTYLADGGAWKECWKSSNKQSIGELWLALLRYYVVEFDFSDMVVCILERGSVTRSSKKWSGRKMSVEDPIEQRRNLARSVSHTDTFEYLLSQLRGAYQYYGIPRTGPDKPLFEKLKFRTEDRIFHVAPTFNMDNIALSAQEVGNQTETYFKKSSSLCDPLDALVEAIDTVLSSCFVESISIALLYFSIRDVEILSVNNKKQIALLAAHFASDFYHILIRDSILQNLWQLSERAVKRNINEALTSAWKRARSWRVLPANQPAGKRTLNALEQHRQSLNVDLAGEKSVSITKVNQICSGSINDTTNQKTGNINDTTNQKTGRINDTTNQKTGRINDTTNQKTDSSNDRSNQETGSSNDPANQEPVSSNDTANQEAGIRNDLANQEPGSSNDPANQEPGSSNDPANQEPGSSNDPADQETGRGNDPVNQEAGNSNDPAKQEPGSSNDPANQETGTEKKQKNDKVHSSGFVPITHISYQLNEIKTTDTSGLVDGLKPLEMNNGVISVLPMLRSTSEVLTFQTECALSRVLDSDDPTFYNSSIVASYTAEQLDFGDSIAEPASVAVRHNEPPELICTLCNHTGHIRDLCDENEPDLRLPFQEITREQFELINKLLNQVPHDFGETEKDCMEREQARLHLLSVITGHYPAAQLTFFGSCVNGFGFHSSDLDLCMTIKAHPTLKDTGVKADKMVCRLSSILRNSPRIRQVVSISSAKVPIVKFKYQSRNRLMDGDISLYNTLALRNTQMLRLYANLDPRVRQLGFVVKLFAKVCEIGDASRGSLSSYAYILMVLHFLQQKGVLPVLQELQPPAGETAEHLIDGWNSWFLSDMTSIREQWRCSNQESLAQLWCGFLRYYVMEFRRKEQVICIRRFAPLLRLEKLWMGATLAIEDPFDLNHNLGGGLSRKMSGFILQVFINALHRASQTHPRYFQTPSTSYEFLFERLQPGAVPRDRCCRLCGKIGHVQRDCGKEAASQVAEEFEVSDKAGSDDALKKKVLSSSESDTIKAADVLTKDLRSLSLGDSAVTHEMLPNPHVAGRVHYVPQIVSSPHQWCPTKEDAVTAANNADAARPTYPMQPCVLRIADGREVIIPIAALPRMEDLFQGVNNPLIQWPIVNFNGAHVQATGNPPNSSHAPTTLPPPHLHQQAHMNWRQPQQAYHRLPISGRHSGVGAPVNTRAVMNNTPKNLRGTHLGPFRDSNANR